MANSQSAGGTATNIKVAVRCRPFIGVCRTVQLRECWNPRPLYTAKGMLKPLTSFLAGVENLLTQSLPF